jgi:hypothetical protein
MADLLGLEGLFHVAAEGIPIAKTDDLGALELNQELALFISPHPQKV